MTTAPTRLALTAIALAATMAVARAQAPDPHHPAAPDAAQTNASPATPAPAPTAGTMPMAPGATPGQAASTMGGGMGQMKTMPEMMRAMMAGGMGGGMGGGMPGGMGADAGGTGMMSEMMGGMMRGMMAGRGMGMPTDHIEGRIAYLKAELKITDAQATAWNTLADAMRANAAAMKGMQDQMGDGGMPATWPARLTLQGKMMAGHLAAMTSLAAAVTPLYAVLSADQRTALDDAMVGPKGMM